MAHFRAINGIGVHNINEISLPDVLKRLPCCRKQMAPHLVPVKEAPGSDPAYDASGKDV